MVTIIDYGMGNLASVYNAFVKTGCSEVQISADPLAAARSEKLVLPGVGAFEDAMKNLRDGRMDQVLQEHVAAGRPLLGICLGFQLVFERSFENGDWPGLGILPGTVQKFTVREPVPHMGWNQVHYRSQIPFCRDLADREYFYYFDHSYYVVPAEDTLVYGVTEYGGLEFCSVAGRENVLATQFHPEKSHDQGLDLVKRFHTGNY